MLQLDIAAGAAIPVEASANPDALFELGMMYSSGRAGIVDFVAAHKWFNLAALRGRLDAIAMRQEVALMMSEAEIAMAQREARLSSERPSRL